MNFLNTDQILGVTTRKHYTSEAKHVLPPQAALDLLLLSCEDPLPTFSTSFCSFFPGTEFPRFGVRCHPAQLDFPARPRPALPRDVSHFLLSAPVEPVSLLRAARAALGWALPLPAASPWAPGLLYPRVDAGVSDHPRLLQHYEHMERRGSPDTKWVMEYLVGRDL